VTTDGEGAGTGLATNTKKEEDMDVDLQLGGHHLVFYWTSIDPTSSLQFLVAHYTVHTLTAHDLHTWLLSTLRELESYGFDVTHVVGDGAGENRGLFNALAKIPASDFITSTRNVNLDTKVAFKHPTHLRPVYIVADWPHLVKKIVTCMENSSGDGARNMQGWCTKEDKECPINLQMIRSAWLASGTFTRARLAFAMCPPHIGLTFSPCPPQNEMK
jgi:hypothetical protein